MHESVVTQVDVARKLLEHFHANVAERRVVPRGGMPFSTFVLAARQALEECPFLPAKLRPDEIFDGIILEVRAGEHWIHERFEVGVNRFSELESRRRLVLGPAQLPGALQGKHRRCSGGLGGVGCRRRRCGVLGVSGRSACGCLRPCASSLGARAETGQCWLREGSARISSTGRSGSRRSASKLDEVSGD